MANKDVFNRDEQNTVSMKELLDQSMKFINEEITHEELVEWSEKVQFYPFLTIRQKVTNIIHVIIDCVYSEDIFDRFVSLEMNKFWYLLLSYTNIKLDETLMTEENYDILYAVCYQWIFDHVKYDYKVCLSLFDTMMNIFKMEDLAITFKELADTDFGKMIEANNKLVSDLSNNKDVIKNLADIMVYTNPDMSKLKEVISTEIVKEINDSRNKKD